MRIAGDRNGCRSETLVLQGHYRRSLPNGPPVNPYLFPAGEEGILRGFGVLHIHPRLGMPQRASRRRSEVRVGRLVLQPGPLDTHLSLPATWFPSSRLAGTSIAAREPRVAPDPRCSCGDIPHPIVRCTQFQPSVNLPRSESPLSLSVAALAPGRLPRRARRLGEAPDQIPLAPPSLLPTAIDQLDRAPPAPGRTRSPVAARCSALSSRR